MERTETTKHGVTLRLNKPLVDEIRVVALEAQLGCRLPEDYREFLLLYNGGKPSPDGFQFALTTDPNASSCVNWFLSLHDGEYSNLERKLDVFMGRIPLETMPIADDPFGNLILLGLRGDVRGKVYFWDHENEPDEQSDWSNVELVAEGFDSFMRGLKSTD